MSRLKCIVSYDGTDYSGFQVQTKEVTIQGEIEAAIRRIAGGPVTIHASGRTDAGVHARGQVFHFDNPSTIPAEKWRFVLNNQLPDSIIIQSVEQVTPEFHARYDVKAKEYRYCIDNKTLPDLIRHRYAHHIRKELDVQLMQQAAIHLIGEHDFTSYCSAKTTKEVKVRTIYDIRVERENDLIWVTCRGNGFLYNMVRIITGTLIEVGKGRKKVEDVPRILAARDREKAGLTAPAKGLTLWEVFY